MPKSDLCNYSGVYIVAKGRISATGTNNANRRHKKVSFKSNAPFRLQKLKINKIYDLCGRA